MSNQPNPSSESWYSPLERQQPEPPKKKKRSAAPWLALLAAFLVVGLIAGSSLFFSGGEEIILERPVLVMPTPPGERPRESAAPEAPDGEEADPVFPESWKDFFEDYFTSDNSGKMENHVPRWEQTLDWQLTFKPAGSRELSLQEVYQRCADSIVAIKSYRDGKLGYYWGSGIVMSEDGLILTNAHLLEDCGSATVILSDDTSYEAKLVGFDAATDLAVLKIEASGLKSAEFGDSEALHVGDHVAAIGNPLGEEFRATMTDGIISAIGRGITHNRRSMKLLQTNTAINEGSSGGALVNMYGQVVGVTNMKMMSSFSSIEGIAFAIPSSTARSIVNSLIANGVVKGRTAIGITVGPVDESVSEHYELPEGLYVSAVTEGSDAEAKGIQVGDIVTAVNGEPVSSTDDILRIKEPFSIGDTLSFTIWRDGESFNMDITLIEYTDIY